MLILGIESTAAAASAALCRDGALLGQYYQCCGLTHSQTLLPMVEALLKNTGVALADVDAVAVARGPGSFTGVRIGVATAKGLCWGAGKNAVGVSTLEAMAFLALSAPEGSVLCPVMDARRAQVYNALFTPEDGRPKRLTADRAIAAADLAEELRALGRPAYVLGDGAAVCARALDEAGIPYRLAPEPIRMQNAWGVCMAAMDVPPAPAGELLPVYLRLSQAERERQARLRRENENTENQ